jgi:hypothetical protein
MRKAPTRDNTMHILNYVILFEAHAEITNRTVATFRCSTTATKAICSMSLVLQYGVVASFKMEINSEFESERLMGLHSTVPR